MNRPDEDYERVGRWLDGEEIELTSAQRALADEIAADAEKVGPALDVSLPPGTLHRVNARIRQTAAVHTPARRWLRWSAAAAAAAIIVAAGVLLLTSRPGDPDTGEGPQPRLAGGDRSIDLVADELDLRVEILAEELASSRVRLTLNGDWPTEPPLSGLEREIGELLLNGDEPATSFDLENWENSL